MACKVAKAALEVLVDENLSENAEKMVYPQVETAVSRSSAVEAVCDRLQKQIEALQTLVSPLSRSWCYLDNLVVGGVTNDTFNFSPVRVRGIPNVECSDRQVFAPAVLSKASCTAEHVN